MSDKKKKPRVLKPHPVPLPDSYSAARRDGEQQRRQSGYTSLRITRKTRELVERMADQAKNVKAKSTRSSGYYSSYYSLGVDELLYFDALERLGELPKGMTEPD